MIDITEDDFNAWKHHPVTKLYLQFLADYEGQVERDMASDLRGHVRAPDAFSLGSLVGYSNALRDARQPTYASMQRFYAPPEEENKEEKELNAA